MIKPINRRSFLFTSVNFFFLFKKGYFLPFIFVNKKMIGPFYQLCEEKLIQVVMLLVPFKAFFFSNAGKDEFAVFDMFHLVYSFSFEYKLLVYSYLCNTVVSRSHFIIGVIFFERWFSTEKKKRYKKV